MENPLKTYPHLLSVSTVAGILDVTEITVRKLIRNKQIRAIKVGKLLKIPEECLMQYLRNYV